MKPWASCLRLWRLGKLAQPVSRSADRAARPTRRSGATATTAVSAVLALVCLCGCVKEKAVRWHAPPFSRGWVLRVGYAAEYDATCSFGAPSLVRMAVVGRERVGAKPGYWLELSSGPEGSRRSFVLDVLSYSDGPDLVFVRGVAEFAGHPSMRLPALSRDTPTWPAARAGFAPHLKGGFLFPSFRPRLAS